MHQDLLIWGAVQRQKPSGIFWFTLKVLCLKAIKGPCWFTARKGRRTSGQPDAPEGPHKQGLCALPHCWCPSPLNMGKPIQLVELHSLLMQPCATSHQPIRWQIIPPINCVQGAEKAFLRPEPTAKTVSLVASNSSIVYLMQAPCSVDGPKQNFQVFLFRGGFEGALQWPIWFSRPDCTTQRTYFAYPLPSLDPFHLP